MAKEVKAAKEEKMSYEELNNVAHQLSEQSKVLYTKLQEANMTNAFKRLDYLFKVLEFSNYFLPEFVASAAAEISAIITLPQVEDEVEPETV